MLEFVRHLIGACGEHSHPSLLTLLAGGVGFSTAITYLKYKYFSKERR